MSFDATDIPEDAVFCTVITSGSGEEMLGSNWTFNRGSVQRSPDLHSDCLVELGARARGLDLTVRAPNGFALGGGSCGPPRGRPEPVIAPGGRIELGKVFCRFVDEAAPASEPSTIKLEFRRIDEAQ